MISKIGAHQSVAGGHFKAIQSVADKGGNCLQIFSSSPRVWQDAFLTEEQLNLFKQKKQEYNIDPIYFHARYLINLADSGFIGTQSIDTLVHELSLADQMQVKGSVIHTGSFKGVELKVDNYLQYRGKQDYHTLIQNIKSALSNTPDSTFVILENAGTRKIGKTMDQLSQILEDVNDDRVRICLDTCHLHAAGYDLTSNETFETFLDNLQNLIGLEKIELIHLNDSKDPFGSLRDRHENIGEGNVGIDVFKNLLNHPKTKHLPFIIETPGFDDKGPDKKNIDILKSLIE